MPASKEKAAPLTAKQEAFCRAIVSGMSQADAYRQAYDAGNMKPATVQSKASILMADGKVRARVALLRKPVIEQAQYDLKQAMAEAADAFQVAKSKGNGGAMVAAAQLRAKLNGLLVDRVKLDATVKGQVAYRANMPARHD